MVSRGATFREFPLALHIEGMEHWGIATEGYAEQMSLRARLILLAAICRMPAALLLVVTQEQLRGARETEAGKQLAGAARSREMTLPASSRAPIRWYPRCS